MDALGCRGFWMGYFASRSAPLGTASVPLVTSVFYNFSPMRVEKALTGAWAATTPAEALAARLRSAAATLRRYGVDGNSDAVRVAAELSAKAARTAPVDGRALFAANTALPWPDDPVEVLWHATTLLREHRGDGHSAALLASGITGRQSNALHCAAGAVPTEYMKQSRDYDDAEWEQCCADLADRGLLTGDGSLTSDGRKLKHRVEEMTDTLALTALRGLDDTEVETLFRALTPITRAVVAGGDVPAATPMALRRDELDDDSAHLS